MDNTLRGFLSTFKVLLVGLLISLLGAPVGSALLSVAVVSGRLAYIEVFDPHYLLDPQWAIWTLMGTIFYGALLGTLIAPALATVGCARRGDIRLAALICLGGGFLPLMCSGALIIMAINCPSDGIVDGIEWGMAVPLAPVFLMSAALMSWGRIRLEYLGRYRS